MEQIVYSLKPLKRGSSQCSGNTVTVSIMGWKHYEIWFFLLIQQQGLQTHTYVPNLAKVEVDLHTEYQGRRSNGSGVRVLTDGRKDGWTDATKHIISLLR